MTGPGGGSVEHASIVSLASLQRQSLSCSVAATAEQGEAAGQRRRHASRRAAARAATQLAHLEVAVHEVVLVAACDGAEHLVEHLLRLRLLVKDQLDQFIHQLAAIQTLGHEIEGVCARTRA